MNAELKQFLLEEAEAWVNKGEAVREVLIARRGDDSWLGAWKALLLAPRVLVVTDNAIVVLDADRNGRPRALLARLPRRTRLGTPLPPTSNLGFTPLDGCRWFHVHGERLWLPAQDAATAKAIDDEWVYKAAPRRAAASD